MDLEDVDGPVDERTYGRIIIDGCMHGSKIICTDVRK